jgi:hypothetical protein
VLKRELELEKKRSCKSAEARKKKQKSDLIKGAARKKIEEGAEQLVRDRTSKREILRVR